MNKQTKANVEIVNLTCFDTFQQQTSRREKKTVAILSLSLHSSSLPPSWIVSIWGLLPAIAAAALAGSCRRCLFSSHCSNWPVCPLLSLPVSPPFLPDMLGQGGRARGRGRERERRRKRVAADKRIRRRKEKME